MISAKPFSNPDVPVLSDRCYEVCATGGAGAEYQYDQGGMPLTLTGTLNRNECVTICATPLTISALSGTISIAALDTTCTTGDDCDSSSVWTGYVRYTENGGGSQATACQATTIYQVWSNDINATGGVASTAELDMIGVTLYSDSALSNVWDGNTNKWNSISDTNGGSGIYAILINDSGVITNVAVCSTPTPTPTPTLALAPTQLPTATPTATPAPTPTPTVNAMSPYVCYATGGSIYPLTNSAVSTDVTVYNPTSSDIYVYLKGTSTTAGYINAGLYSYPANTLQTSVSGNVAYPGHTYYSSGWVRVIAFQSASYTIERDNGGSGTNTSGYQFKLAYATTIGGSKTDINLSGIGCPTPVPTATPTPTPTTIPTYKYIMSPCDGQSPNVVAQSLSSKAINSVWSLTGSSYADQNYTVIQSTTASHDTTIGSSAICDSGDDGCLLTGTQVEMHDGTFKSIEDIQTGDTVMSRAITGMPDSDDIDVLRTWSSESIESSSCLAQVKSITGYRRSSIVYINSGLLYASQDHMHVVKQNGTWTVAESRELNLGDFLLDKDGQEIEITHLQTVYGDHVVWKLDVEENDIFIANGIVTHNAKGIR